jgi:hypothetical protein
MKINQSITLLDSGLNSDDSLEIMPLGDSPTTFASVGRQNVIIPPDNYGKLEDAWGAALVAGTSGIVSATKYMGHAVDTEGEWCYYILAGEGASLNSNSIIGVNLQNPDVAIRQVLVDEIELELDTDIVFKKASYIDGWIYWASGAYGPMKVNVDRAINYTTYKNSAWDSTETYSSTNVVLCADGGIYTANDAVSAGEDPPNDNTKWDLTAYAYANTAVDGVASLLDGSFDLVDFPPIVPVTGTYDDDVSRLYNNLRGKMFQFTYRWKYKDSGYTVTAPFSELFLSPDVESYSGEILNSFCTNNMIKLTFNGGSPVDIEYVELYVRMGQALSWQYVDKIDGGTDTYNFYNDFLMEVADDDTVNKLDNFIPTKTRALELLSENVLVLGGNTFIGDPGITPDVKLTVGWENVALNASGAVRYTAAIGEEIIVYPEGESPIYYNKVTLNTAISVGGVQEWDILVINLYYGPFTLLLDYIVTADDISGGITALRDSIIALINNGGVDVAAAYDGAPVGMSLTSGDFYVFTQGFAESLDTATSGMLFYAQDNDLAVNKWSQFTTGARHVFGITYFDRAMRPFAVATNGTMGVYVPTVPEEKGASEDYDWKNHIDWEILHEAPATAKYWQWFYAGNQNIDDFWFYVIDAADGSSATLTLTLTSLQDVQSTYPLSQVGPYVWEKGDRFRAITDTIVSGGDYGSLCDTKIDLEITSYDADTSKITVATSSSAEYGLGISSLVQIYRPKTAANDDLFFAFSKIYKTYVFSGNVYHEGDTRDQTGDTEGVNGAAGSFDKGDSYLIARAFNVALGSSPVGSLFLVESPSYSDFYDSAWYTMGKVNVRSNIGEVDLNNIAISNRLIQDTGINGLCTFEAADVVSLPDKHGQVNAMRQIGRVLRVIQQRKRTSFYVGMTELIDQNGNVNVVATSDSILGNQRELDGDWGTENPESVCQVDDKLFFWDLHNRAFMQDSENGAYAVSDNKMRKFFIELGDEIIEALYLSNDYLLSCDYEPITQTVHFYYYIEGVGERVMLYHLPSKRWVSSLNGLNHTTTYDVSGLMWAENRFFVVDDGKLYLMSTAANRREFVGNATKAAAFIKVVGNQDPLIPKIIDTVGLISNQHTAWTVDAITIPADPTTKVEQSSKALSTDWLTREGVTRAPVKRNQYTSGIYKYSDLFEGEKMRGRVVEVTFTLPTQTSGNIEVTAFEIGMTTSK